MYMTAMDRQFGAWRLSDVAPSSGVRFSIFLPDRGRDATQHAEQPAEPPRDIRGNALVIEGYGNPRIASIHVVGDFQTELGQPANWQLQGANALARTGHPSGSVWRLDTAPLPAGF